MNADEIAFRCADLLLKAAVLVLLALIAADWC